jgi:hypothetical protein
LTTGSAPPDTVRAGASFPLDVELSTQSGPILLASSREDLPYLRGETQVLARYRSTRGVSTHGNRGLSADLVPGTPITQRWNLGTPALPGRYDVDVSLLPLGVATRPSAWVPLFTDLRVVAE